METPRTWTTRNLTLVLALGFVLAACSEEGPIEADAEANTMDGESDTAGFADGEAWFAIDESAEITSGVTGTTSTGTVTLLAGADPVRSEEVTAPIVADVTWTIDGVPHDFVAFDIGVDRCPVPDSGDVDDIAGFRGVGFDPDGRPLNLNAGAPALAVNTTYDPDWRSTAVAHGELDLDWVIVDGEMRTETPSVSLPDSDETPPGTIVVTCR